MEQYDSRYRDEYQMLRTEIMKCVDLQNSLSTFMITAVTALLALAFTNMNPWLFLLPYVVILPIGYGILHYRANVYKLASYIIVYLEPQMPEMNWETRHVEYTKANTVEKLFVFRNYLSVFLSVVVYFLFLYSYFSAVHFALPLQVLVCLLALLPAAYMLFISVLVHKRYSSREVFMQRWETVVPHKPKQNRSA